MRYKLIDQSRTTIISFFLFFLSLSLSLSLFLFLCLSRSDGNTGDITHGTGAVSADSVGVVGVNVGGLPTSASFNVAAGGGAAAAAVAAGPSGAP